MDRDREKEVTLKWVLYDDGYCIAREFDFGKSLNSIDASYL